MELEEFKKFLQKSSLENDLIESYCSLIHTFKSFLQSHNATIDSFPNGLLTDFTEKLVKDDKEKVIVFIRALLDYSNFAKVFSYMEELIDIIESHNAMDTLYDRVAEYYGEKVRDKVFDGITIPPVGVHPEKKPEVTKVILKRLEDELGEEKTIELLRPCLHGRAMEPINEDRKTFEKLGDLDAFLARKKQDLINVAQKHHEDGSVWFAQFVDRQALDYLKKTPTVGVGIRKGDKIIVSKIPYQITKFLNAKSDSMKRFYLCYCPWVRGAIKKGEENDISRNFCYCSGGFFKIYWDGIFGEPVKVEPLETALWGDSVCKFAIQIPKKYLKK